MARLYAALALLVLWNAGAQENPERMLQEAIALHRGGNAEGAIPRYRAYLKVRPDAVDARSNLGAALSSTGRYADAITEYRLALKARPQDNRIRLNMALAHYKLGQISEAATQFSALHAAQPADAQTTLLLADCWLRQGEDRKVIALLTPVEQREQGNQAVAYMLGTALLRDKQIARGQRIIDRILKNGDSAEARLLLGTAKLGAMDVEGAIADLRKAAELNPNLAEVHAWLGRAHMEAGDSAQARLDFEKELQQNPNDYESNLNLGVVLRQERNYEGARKLLARALRVRPGDMRTRFQLASVSLDAGDLEKARMALEGIVGEAPHFVEAHVALATTYYRLKRKGDGDRERELARKLTAEQEAEKLKVP